jgi:hypothetical protein
VFDAYQTDALRVSDPHETTVFRLRDTLNTYFRKHGARQFRFMFASDRVKSRPVETGGSPITLRK